MSEWWRFDPGGSRYGRNALHWAQIVALHPHLERGHVREIRIVLPPAEEQGQILRNLEKRLADLDSLLGKMVEDIDPLKEFRAALISAAVTGKIDVRGEAGG